MMDEKTLSALTRIKTDTNTTFKSYRILPEAFIHIYNSVFKINISK